jgi:hypothetical protein
MLSAGCGLFAVDPHVVPRCFCLFSIPYRAAPDVIADTPGQRQFAMRPIRALQLRVLA